MQESNTLKKNINRDQYAIILMRKVNVRYGNKVVLENFNWTVKKGENWKIVGPNGAGKTTLAKLILGPLPYCGVIQRDEKISNFAEIAHVSLEQQKILVAREEKKDRYQEYSGN